MIVLCSWCNKDMGMKESLDNKEISHGICEKCQERLKGEDFEQNEHRMGTESTGGAVGGIPWGDYLKERIIYDTERQHRPRKRA